MGQPGKGRGPRGQRNPTGKSLCGTDIKISHCTLKCQKVLLANGRDWPKHSLWSFSQKRSHHDMFKGSVYALRFPVRCLTGAWYTDVMQYGSSKPARRNQICDPSAPVEGGTLGIPAQGRTCHFILHFARGWFKNPWCCECLGSVLELRRGSRKSKGMVEKGAK